MKSSKLLALVIVLQAMILLTLWCGPWLPSAHADMPDALNTRNETVTQLRDMNTKFDRMLEILSSGNLQVRLAPADDTKDQPRRSGR